jgi:hypothetical protein
VGGGGWNGVGGGRVGGGDMRVGGARCPMWRPKEAAPLASGPDFQATGSHRQSPLSKGRLSTALWRPWASGPKTKPTPDHRQSRLARERLSTAMVAAWASGPEIKPTLDHRQFLAGEGWLSTSSAGLTSGPRDPAYRLPPTLLPPKRELSTVEAFIHRLLLPGQNCRGSGVGWKSGPEAKPDVSCPVPGTPPGSGAQHGRKPALRRTRCPSTCR